MLDPLIDPASRADALRVLYGHLRFGESCAIVGLNDVGKTTLLSLALMPATAQRYGRGAAQRGADTPTTTGAAGSDKVDASPATSSTRTVGARRPTEGRLMVRVDCNLLATSTERELYAVMAQGLAGAARVRGQALAAGLADLAVGPPDLAAVARLVAAYLERAHSAVQPATSGLPAALEFESFLATLVEEFGLQVAFLFDEFDATYRQMEARVALALRAFRNRLGLALAYVVAVDQPLERIRQGAVGGETAEFEELFVGRSHVLGPLQPTTAAAFVERYFASRSVPVADWTPPVLAALTGGHPGLLWTACAAATRQTHTSPAQIERDLLASPEVRAECENVWTRLPSDERQALVSGSQDASRSETAPLIDALRERGLLRPGAGSELAIPLLERYLARTAETKAVGLLFDLQTGEIAVDGRPLLAPLGPTEFRLLSLLYGRAGALVTKDEIARAIWPEEERLGRIDDARIDKLVDRVRAKIEPDPRTPRFLHTVRGLGYRFVPHH